jgi:hypothetical protein
MGSPRGRGAKGCGAEGGGVLTVAMGDGAMKLGLAM